MQTKVLQTRSYQHYKAKVYEQLTTHVKIWLENFQQLWIEWRTLTVRSNEYSVTIILTDARHVQLLICCKITMTCISIK